MFFFLQFNRKPDRRGHQSINLSWVQTKKRKKFTAVYQSGIRSPAHQTVSTNQTSKWAKLRPSPQALKALDKLLMLLRRRRARRQKADRRRRKAREQNWCSQKRVKREVLARLNKTPLKEEEIQMPLVRASLQARVHSQNCPHADSGRSCLCCKTCKTIRFILLYSIVFNSIVISLNTSVVSRASNCPKNTKKKWQDLEL